jgi:hypothetical protein
MTIAATMNSSRTPAASLPAVHASFVTPYGTEIVEMTDAQKVVIFDIGGPHTSARYSSTASLIQRSRSQLLWRFPRSLGRRHARGGNDGFNEASDGPRRLSAYGETAFYRKVHADRFDTMKYEVTVDDPGAYTAPWTNTFQMRWNGNQELFEYVCQDNNFAPVLLVGQEEKVDRTSVIIP